MEARRAGRAEAEEWTHGESVATQAVVDAMRRAVIEQDCRGRLENLENG